MEGSIQTCIERIIPKNTVSPTQDAALRLSFVKHLAQVNDKGEVVRLTARWADLPEAAKPILDKFVNERLLTKSEHNEERSSKEPSVTVEVAHEAMFRCWKDLKEWLRTSTDILRWRRDVRRDQANDKDWTNLSSAQLAVARSWPAERGDELTRDELMFINNGIFWQRARLVVAVTILLFVAGLAVVATVNWRKAVNERRIATARAVLAFAQNEEPHNSERALAMAVEAYDLARQTQGLRLTPFEDTVRRTLSETRVRQTIELPDNVTGVAWHPSESKIATASGASGVRIWNPDTGKPIATKIPNTKAFSVRWSPTGQRLGVGLFSAISCGTEDQQELLQRSLVEGWVADLAWSSDEKRVAFTTLGDTGGIWNIETNKIVSFPEGMKHSAVSWSHNGKSIATGTIFRTSNGSTDRGIAIWRPDDGQRTGLLRGSETGILSLAWSPDDTSIVAGSDDGSVILWDVATEQKLQTFMGHMNQAVSVAWHPSGNWFCSGSWDGSIRIGNSTTGKTEAILTGHVSPIYAVDWSSDGTHIVSGSQDGTAKVWDAHSSRTPKMVRRGNRWMNAVDVSPDDRFIASAGDDGTIELWDIAADRSAKVIKAHDEYAFCVAWNPSGRRLASSSGATIKIWNPDSGELVRTLEGPKSDLFGISWAPDGVRMAAAYWEGSIMIWNSESGEVEVTLKVVSPTAISWSPDGRWLAFPDITTGSVLLWDTTKRSDKTVELGGHSPNAGIWGIAWTRDCKRLASASDDDTVRIWDVQARRCVHVLSGHSSDVKAVAWSSDNKLLATGSLDNTVRIWDAESGQKMATLPGHTSGVRSVKWTSNGTYVVSAGEDGRVLLSLVRFGDVLSVARKQVMFGLTGGQRRAVAAELKSGTGAD
jgi:WD40 repeat protein